MHKELLLIGLGVLVGCASPARPPVAANRSLSITSAACDDASAVDGARQAFDRAKDALGRLPGVESVSIGECDVFWAGHFYQSIDPSMTVPAPVGPTHQCGVQVTFADRESLRHFADSAFVFGTFIPYGSQTEVKRVRACGLLAGASGAEAPASK